MMLCAVCLFTVSLVGCGAGEITQVDPEGKTPDTTTETKTDPVSGTNKDGPKNGKVIVD